MSVTKKIRKMFDICAETAAKKGGNEHTHITKDKMLPYLDEIDAEHAKLKAENTELQKLLTFYLGCLTKGHVNCDSCAFAEDICGHGRKVIDWARRLGIDTDA